MKRGELWWADLGPHRPQEPKSALVELIRPLSVGEMAELELATDEALGRVEPE